LWRLREVKNSDENEEINKRKIKTVAYIKSRNERTSHRWKAEAAVLFRHVRIINVQIRRSRNITLIEIIHFIFLIINSLSLVMTYTLYADKIVDLHKIRII